MLSRIFNIKRELFFGVGTFDFDLGMVYIVLETFAIGFLGTSIGAIFEISFGFLGAESLVDKKGSEN